MMNNNRRKVDVEELRKLMQEHDIFLQPWQTIVMQEHLRSGAQFAGVTIEFPRITPTLRHIMTGGPTRNPVAGASRPSTRWTSRRAEVAKRRRACAPPQSDYIKMPL